MAKDAINPTSHLLRKTTAKRTKACDPRDCDAELGDARRGVRRSENVGERVVKVRKKASRRRVSQRPGKAG